MCMLLAQFKLHYQIRAVTLLQYVPLGLSATAHIDILTLIKGKQSP